MTGAHDRRKHRVMVNVTFSARLSTRNAATAIQFMLDDSPSREGVFYRAERWDAKQGEKALAAYMRSRGVEEKMAPIRELTRRALDGKLEPFEALRQIELHARTRKDG